MTRPGYLSLRLTDATTPLIDALCRHLLTDPGERGARAAAVNFALRYACAELGLAEDADALQADGGADGE